MSTSLIPLEPLSAEPSFALTQAQARLRKMVLDSVQSIHSKRNYAKASMICLPSVPADLSPVPCLWSTGRRWIPFSIHYQRTVIRDAKVGRRSQTERNDRA
jgi:hypothetical protein